MGKKPVYLFVIVFLILWLSGCARFEVGTTGFLDKDKAATGIPNEATFAAIENDKAPNPIFDKEIRLKIEKLIRKKGFSVTNPETADYCLLFSYSIDNGKTVTESVPFYPPPQMQYVKVYGRHGGYRWVDYITPSFPAYYPVSVRYFTKKLMIKVINGESYRKDKKEEVFWMGDSVSVGESSDLRKAIDYLLVGTFRYFGQDTGKRVNLSLTADDEEVKELSEQGTR